MKLIPVLIPGPALVLAALSCVAQLAFAQGASPPPAPLNIVSADNQSAGAPNFVRPYDACPGGAEQALRHQIETMVAGRPDYDVMAPKVAAEWRTEVDRSVPVTRQWGALVSLKQYPGTWSATYEAQFEHARVQWKIACRGTYGKITGISFKTLS